MHSNKNGIYTVSAFPTTTIKRERNLDDWWNMINELVQASKHPIMMILEEKKSKKNNNNNKKKKKRKKRNDNTIQSMTNMLQIINKMWLYVYMLYDMV